MKFSQYTYQRVEFNEFETEYKKALELLKDAPSFEEQSNAISVISKISKKFDTAANLVAIRHSIDTTDSFYADEQNYIDSVSPAVWNLTVEYYKALNQSPFKEQLISTYGKQIFVYAELATLTVNEAILADMKEENMLRTEYEKLLASASIPFDGEDRNLAGLEPFMESPDREIRKRASEARFGWMASKMNDLDSIYDKLVKTRHNMAQKMGFENFIPMGYARMRRSGYGPEEIAEFRNLIFEEVVPLANELKKRQAKRLGLESLMYYDYSFSYNTGNPTPKGNPDWIINHGKTMYDELSPETSSFFRFMLDKELMDLVNKKGKAGGGYCTYIADYQSPFIFSNFNGTSHDIDVLTHEAGHAFQVFNSRELPLDEYYWPTSEAAEIHSMSMEFFTWPWMNLFFEADTDKYYFTHLSSSMQFLPYGTTVDEFQHKVYANPDMSPEDRRKTWREIELKYTPWKKYEGNEYLMNGGYWQRQAHIYASPFYYIDYVLAQICAFQFWVRMRQDKNAAWNDYVKLCKAGGSMPFLDLVQLAGLKSPFKKETLKEVVSQISEYLNTVDDTKL